MVVRWMWGRDSVNGFGKEMGDDVGGHLGWFLGVRDWARVGIGER